MRKIYYVTGTRADFGLMENALQAINENPLLDLRLVITGMHLLPKYGATWHEIENSKLLVSARVPVTLTGNNSGAEMANALGEQIIGFTKIFQLDQPDLVLLLGDRGEMLASAIAALHLNIPIVHIHGGELSGTVDESVRHAISKLAHYHFVATEKSRERLARMGELNEHIFVTGAPGLDAIVQTPLLSRHALLQKFKLDQSLTFILVVFHPVVQDATDAGKQMRVLLDAVLDTGMQAFVLMPNADAGGSEIERVITEYDKQYDFLNYLVHIERNIYLSLLAEAQVMLGNSSSGIIEAASLATPVVNVGKRQNRRERNINVIDCTMDKASILNGVRQAVKMKGKVWQNVYGDGHASERIVKLLTELPLTLSLLDKVNVY